MMDSDKIEFIWNEGFKYDWDFICFQMHIVHMVLQLIVYKPIISTVYCISEFVSSMPSAEG